MNDFKEQSTLMGKRLKALRESKGLSHVALRDELREKYDIDISRDSLINYEVSDKEHPKAFKNDGMRVEYLRYLADFYGVSTDYLLGLTDVKAPDASLRAVCEYTGLSEGAVNRLKDSRYREDGAWFSHSTAEIIDYILSANFSINRIQSDIHRAFVSAYWGERHLRERKFQKATEHTVDDNFLQGLNEQAMAASRSGKELVPYSAAIKLYLDSAGKSIARIIEKFAEMKIDLLRKELEDSDSQN